MAATTGQNYMLLGVLQNHAPTGVDQDTVATWYRSMYDVGASHLEVQKALVRALSDGLNSGNWPWAPKPKPQTELRCRCRGECCRGARRHHEPT